MDEARLSAMQLAFQSGDSAQVIPELQALNTLLEAAPSSAVKVLAAIPLPLLFSCLETTDEQQLAICCAVLEKLFSTMSPADLSRHVQYLELGLQHPSSPVRKVSLKVLDKNLTKPEVVESVITAPTMFHLLTQVIGDDSLECAQLAQHVIKEVTATCSSLDRKMKEALVLDLCGLAGKAGDTVRYRVYELAVHVAVTGGEMYERVRDLLLQLVSELNKGDVLVRMNCLELLVQLMDSEEGAGLLQETQVLEKLHVQLVDAQSNPLGSFVIPGILKYFGHFALLRGAELPRVCEQCPEFLSLVLETVSSSQDETLVGVAMDTFGVVGSTVAGRHVLDHHKTETTDAIKTLGNLVANARTELRLRALETITTFFSCKDEGPISHSWFKHLHHKFLSVILAILQQPFTDLRLASLLFLLSIAPYRWAQEEMRAQPGLFEYLLNRRTEEDKRGKELKYEVVRALVASDTAAEVFGGPNFLKLRQYEMEGPFYVTSETVVATQGST